MSTVLKSVAAAFEVRLLPV